LDQNGSYTDYGFVADFYDHVVPYRDKQDIAFYVQMASSSEGPVLELGCGTGRVLIPIARADNEIVGLDSSPHMLRVCREKLAHEPEDVRTRVELIQAEMGHFDLDRKFDLITTPFRPFQHLLTVGEQLSCLSCVHSHLSDDGVFVLDLFNPFLQRLVDEKYLVETDDEPEFTMSDGRKVIRRPRTISRDLFNQVNENEIIYYIKHPDGREERQVHRFKMRHLFRFEAEHLLVRSGFEVVEIYADYDRNPYGSKYPGELIIVSRKA
jgi:SAM-dependent methyltransferase